jgi:DNA-binding winged helix-turn-helix (wHTH) protein
MQPQPFRLLLLLANRAGTVVTREEIQQCLWTGSTFVDFEHGINFSINQIRAALADNAEKPRYIETLPRRGYRFIGSISPYSGVPRAPHPIPMPEVPTPLRPNLATAARTIDYQTQSAQGSVAHRRIEWVAAGLVLSSWDHFFGTEIASPSIRFFLISSFAN